MVRFTRRRVRSEFAACTLLAAGARQGLLLRHDLAARVPRPAYKQYVWKHRAVHTPRRSLALASENYQWCVLVSTSEMDSTGFDADIFIEAVKNRPVIWNFSLPEYHDKIKKRNAWTEVCSLMSNGFEDKSEKEQNDLGTKLMKKWKGLRDTFTKSMKKKTVSGQGASNRTYIYARQMEFLLHCGISSATSTSVDEDTETQIDEDADDPVEERNVAASPEPPVGPSSRQSPPLSATPDATAAKNVPRKRTHPGSEFSRIPAAKRRVIVEESLLKFINSTPAETPVQPTDDDKSFFESLLPIVKTLPTDTKLEFRCSVMNKLKQLRTSVGNAQNIPSTTTQQQHTMHNDPQMLQQQYSYTNLSPVDQESHMDQSYTWVSSPSNNHSQHSSYTSPIHRNTIE